MFLLLSLSVSLVLYTRVHRQTCGCLVRACILQFGGHVYILYCTVYRWLIEVNASPSLTASSKEDYDLKCRLLDDVLNVIDLENRQTDRQQLMDGTPLPKPHPYSIGSPNITPTLQAPQTSPLLYRLSKHHPYSIGSTWPPSPNTGSDPALCIFIVFTACHSYSYFYLYSYS